MTRRRLGGPLVMLLLVGLWPSAGAPYSRLTTSTGHPLVWTEREVPLDLVLPCLPDACYEAAAIAAAAAWSAAGGLAFPIPPTPPAVDPCGPPDGRNTVGFAPTLCGGLEFPPGVAALTLTTWFPSGAMVEAEVLFNSGLTWGVYEGPQRRGRVDFHRIALHEFGHVAGLAHPDEQGQVVAAIMNSYVGDIDRLHADDIAGMRALYGRPGAAAPKGALENPGNRSAKSGIGVISGWVCEADVVEVEIGTQRSPVAYGTPRGDTAAVCGDTANGFVTLVNWNLLGDGLHTLRLLVDGVPLGGATFIVTTFGQEFLQGVTHRAVVHDFPTPGAAAVIEWDEGVQNFVVVGTE